VGANDIAIDRLESVWNSPALVQGLENALPVSSGGNGGKRSTICRTLQANPATARQSHDPENPLQNEAMVDRLATSRSTDGKNEVFKPRPFLVAHWSSGQDGVLGRHQLESHQRRDVNLLY